MSLKTIFLFLLLPVVASAQLVNIETKRIETDTSRLILNSDLSFNYSDNNGVQVAQINATITSQLKSKNSKRTYLFLGNYELIDSDEANLQNSWFLHTRFNYKFSKAYYGEAFLQSQYNQLLVVRQRHLIGAGLRVRLIGKKRFSSYLGNSYMYEMEYSKRAATTDFNHRHSTYLSLSYRAKSKKFSLTNTVYYQPLYRDLNDFRILEQFRLDLPLSDWFKVFSLFNYYFDSKTPIYTEEYTSQLEFGIGFNL